MDLNQSLQLKQRNLSGDQEKKADLVLIDDLLDIYNSKRILLLKSY